MHFSHEITNSGEMSKDIVIKFQKNYFLFHEAESTRKSILRKMLTVTRCRNCLDIFNYKKVLQIKLNMKLKSKT